ncbi:MAG: hypothetical protein AAF125_09530, partial [Chloroflexota bacterium]
MAEMPTNPRQVRWLLIAAALGIIGIMLILAYVPIQGALSRQVGDATINLTVDRRFIPALNNCVTYSWDVEGVQAVYFNDSGTVGQGSASHCVRRGEALPELRLEFADGGDATYRLGVSVITQVWWFWVLGMMAVGLILYALLPPRVNHALWRAAEVTAIWIVILVVFLEGGFRLYIAMTGTPRERILYFESVERIKAANRFYPELFTLFALS